VGEPAFKREEMMRYFVYYRLTHSKYRPAGGVAVVQANTHAELENGLIKVRTKWEQRGYQVRILKVRGKEA